MNKRPTSVTVIAWILIVIAPLSALTITFSLQNPTARELMARSPIPMPIQIAMSYAGLLVTFVCGIAFLKGQNWARYLYVGWSVVGFIVGFATSPMKFSMIPGFVFVLVIAFFLFRPKATRFFTAIKADHEPQGV